ncbi:hypothetical protein OIU79_017866 [Salix purpurea]|uniref:Uncharacterized protein n=1 Tax=Salix purpurea TaxID=77065 RepID=A0A9Q1AKA7_SALPP|nr:hypothetical protein OIU79_017866 [Salix purpurea]
MWNQSEFDIIRVQKDPFMMENQLKAKEMIIGQIMSVNQGSVHKHRWAWCLRPLESNFYLRPPYACPQTHPSYSYGQQLATGMITCDWSPDTTSTLME